jgi:hypothetical protein
MNENNLEEKINCDMRSLSKEKIIGAPKYICNSKGVCPYQWKLDECEERNFCTYYENIITHSNNTNIQEIMCYNR